MFMAMPSTWCCWLLSLVGFFILGEITMQNYEIRFKIKNQWGTFGNQMTQVIRAWTPNAAMDQLRAQFGGASQVEICGWNPAK
jgi:hypothetical protein